MILYSLNIHIFVDGCKSKKQNIYGRKKDHQLKTQ